MNDDTRRSWPLVAAWLLLLGLLGAIGGVVLRRTDGFLVYPLDDTYIQMAIAKNLARQGVWGVTPYAFSGGGSSVLWPLVLAATYLGAGLRDAAPFVLNAIFGALLVWVADRILRRHIARDAHRFTALVLLILATPLQVLPWIGMEHTLQVLLAIALADTACRLSASDAGNGRALGLTVILAACTMAIRYDTGAVIAVVTIMLFARRGPWPAAAVAAGMAAPVVAYGIVASSHGWPFLPSPVLLKHRLLGVSGFTWHDLADILGGGALTVLVNEPSLFALVLTSVALLVIRPVQAAQDPQRERESRLLLVTFVGATLIHVEFGRLGWLYRYGAYLNALGIVAVASAIGHRPILLSRLLPRTAKPIDDAARVALATLLIFPLVLRGVQATRALVAESEAVYTHEYQLGRFFERYPTAGALMTGDIGTIAYFGDVKIVDPSGLASREFIDMVRAAEYDRGLVARVAEAHGVRVSLTGSPEESLEGWVCVARFGARVETRPWMTYFHAADAAAAAELAESLRQFRQQDALQVNDIRLASEDPDACQVR